MFSVIENSVNLDAVKFDAFYLVKLIFGKYFCYFDANYIADLLQLHLQLDTIHVLVSERVNRLFSVSLFLSTLSLFLIYSKSIFFFPFFLAGLISLLEPFWFIVLCFSI